MLNVFASWYHDEYCVVFANTFIGTCTSELSYCNRCTRNIMMMMMIYHITLSVV